MGYDGLIIALRPVCVNVLKGQAEVVGFRARIVPAGVGNQTQATVLTGPGRVAILSL